MHLLACADRFSASGVYVFAVLIHEARLKTGHVGSRSLAQQRFADLDDRQRFVVPGFALGCERRQAGTEFRSVKVNLRTEIADVVPYTAKVQAGQLGQAAELACC